MADVYNQIVLVARILGKSRLTVAEAKQTLTEYYRKAKTMKGDKTPVRLYRPRHKEVKDAVARFNKAFEARLK